MSLSNQEDTHPCYPPTRVRSWLVCPELWRLEKRWTPREDGLWSPKRLLGSALHTGAAEHFRALRSGSPISLEETHAKAHIVLAREYVEQDVWTLESLNRLVDKGITLLLGKLRLTPGTKILAVDEPVDRRKPDLVTSLNDKLSVYDWKLIQSLDSRYLHERLDAFLHSWQLLDYAYFTQEHFQRPVVEVSPVLVILGPKAMVQMQPVHLEPERIQQWKQQADVVWALMSSGKPWMNLEACDDKHLHFGKKCPMYQGCHLLYGNETLFSSIYRVVEEGTHG